tara:strand:- start:1012 stop:1530 length:519 start_codon:yes stop_codon:yes gene_type:complete
MPIRATQKEKTATKAEAAIQRILEGTYTNKILIKRKRNGKKIKLNQSTVEMEAGLGVRTLRNHPNVLEKIDKINNPELVENQPVFSTNYSSTEVEKLKNDKKTLQKQKNEQLEKYKLERTKRMSLENINKEIHANYIQLTCALFDLVPQQERQDLFDKPPKKVQGDVVPLKK